MTPPRLKAGTVRYFAWAAREGDPNVQTGGGLGLPTLPYRIVVAGLLRRAWDKFGFGGFDDVASATVDAEPGEPAEPLPRGMEEGAVWALVAFQPGTVVPVVYAHPGFTPEQALIAALQFEATVQLELLPLVAEQMGRAQSRLVQPAGGRLVG